MLPSSEGNQEVRPVGQPVGGVSAMAQVRSGPPRGAGWGPRPLFISHAWALASSGVTVEGCPKLVFQSVLSRLQLSCVCVWFVRVCESTSVCAGCVSPFLSSLQTRHSEQM
uniref:Uncharacterized protein n=1 Tax=Cercocebus atys TaxID=9531 RepID=A0A2K5MMC3_CERAT